MRSVVFFRGRADTRIHSGRLEALDVSNSATAEPRSSPAVQCPELDARVDRCRLGPVALGVYNALYWPYLFLSCALLFFPALALRLLTFCDPKRRLLSRYTSVWGA